MAVIHYIGSTLNTEKYDKCASFFIFMDWIKEQKDSIGFDVETNKTSSILDRELICLQFGSHDGETIWVIQWSHLEENQKNWLLNFLNTTSLELIIFTNFEYVLMRKYGILLKNIWDAYRVEKVLNTGYTVEGQYFSLAETYRRRFSLLISKDLQGEFGDDIITDAKVEYAAFDVLKLGQLKDIQLIEARDLDKNILGNVLSYFKRKGTVSKSRETYYKGVEKTIWWENEFTKVLGDMEYDGIRFDSNIWIDTYNKTLPKHEKALSELNDCLVRTFPLHYLKSEKFYTDVDTIESIWTSPQKKLLVLGWIFPGLEATNQHELKTYLKEYDPNFPNNQKLTGKSWDESEYSQIITKDKWGIIKLLIKRNKKNSDEIDKTLDKVISTNFRNKLIENGLLIPANTVLINWGSPVQRLKIFQFIDPSMKSTKREFVELIYHKHELVKYYIEFADYDSLITKFGLNYLENVDADGRIRAHYDTPLDTGRISAAKPNVLQLPANQDYRDAFVASPGYNIVGADYSSEELLIIALLSNDPVWMESFRQGDDVHSVNASLIYGQEWINAAEPDCVFMSSKQKCSCKRHKEMRTFSKQISFGLSYGLSAHGASIRLKITKREAQDLIDKFFTTFPSIKKKLDQYGNFGVKYGYIMTTVFGRPRFFDKWKMAVIRQSKNGMLDPFNDNEARKHEGAITRESANMPIQGNGADILKISGVLLRRFIINNNYLSRIKLLVPPHDEHVTECEEELSEMWSNKLQHYMELAGKLALKTDLLKAEPYIAKQWTK